MARAIWTGALSFGLVNVPVALFTGVRDRGVHFHQLHAPDGARIETRRFCAQDDAEVALEEIGHGYELDDGRQVVLTDDDLAAAAPRRTRTIDIEAFVDLEEVDPIFFDHPYWLAPTGEAEGNLRAYRLLAEVLESAGRAALGRFVLRTREYLVLVRVRDGRLALTTMLFHDEIRSPDALDTGSGARRPAKAQRDAARRLVEAMSTGWDPSRYHDRYRERLLAIIERKKRGQRITVPAADREREDAGGPPDLMAALKASLDRARESGAGEGADEDDERGGEVGDLTRDELYQRAQEAGVPGRSSMSKDELAAALAERS